MASARDRHSTDQHSTRIMADQAVADAPLRRVRTLTRHCSSAPASAGGITVSLNYQLPPPAGKRTGRYIGRPDEGDVVDTYDPHPVLMRNARLLPLEDARLETSGFELRVWPTKVVDFADEEEVRSVYYREQEALLKQMFGPSARQRAAGAGRHAQPFHV